MDGNENPIAGIEPPKSRKKLYIFGGLGCLGVIGLACLGLGAIGYFFGLKPMQEFSNQNLDIAVSSPEVEIVLGTPIEAGTMTPTQAGPQKFSFSGPLTGPNGTGTLTFVGELKGTEWIRESIHLEFNGEKTDLNPEALFELNIDPGTSSGQ